MSLQINFAKYKELAGFDKKHHALIDIIKKLFKSYEAKNVQSEINIIIELLENFAESYYKSDNKPISEKNEKDPRNIERRLFALMLDEFRKANAEGDELVPFDIMDFLVKFLQKSLVKKSETYAKTA